MDVPVPDKHRAEAPQSVGCGVLTVSDTRTIQTDRGGQTVCEMLEAAGHSVVARQIVPDDPHQLRKAIQSLLARGAIDAVLVTGGTGLGSRDQTCEALSAMLTKPLPGFGELFRMLSYAEIGAAAMLSRALGGLVEQTVVLSMPGSPAAVRLAMEKLILPELGHLVREARR